MDRRWGIAVALLALAGCAETQRGADTVVAAAAAQVNPTLSTSDASFMTIAGRGGIAEVQMAQLAERNGQSPAVKRFARKMLEDHGQTNQAMAAMAQRKQITPPETMGADQQQIYDRLATLRGRAFDRAYAQAMVADHEEDLRAFETEASNGTDAEVRAMAARHVPMLREHLRMAKALPQR
jgi:putative membrane protein